MFTGCAVCGDKNASINWMGFIHRFYCRDCYENRREECNTDYGAECDKAERRVAKEPELKYTDIASEFNAGEFQDAVEKKENLDEWFLRIASWVYDFKYKGDDYRHWSRDKQKFLDEAVSFCYDRLHAYPVSDTLALDYFSATAATVYSRMKLENRLEWSY